MGMVGKCHSSWVFFIGWEVHWGKSVLKEVFSWSTGYPYIRGCWVEKKGVLVSGGTKGNIVYYYISVYRRKMEFNLEVNEIEKEKNTINE